MDFIKAMVYLLGAMEAHLPNQAIILAGGLGSRLKSLVSEVPKPLAPIRGKPFVEYVLDRLITQGVSEVVFAVSHKAQSVISVFGDEYRSSRVRYSVELEPLGTGGAVVQASNALSSHGPFLLINGDTMFDVSLCEMTEFHESVRSDLTLATREIPNREGVQYGGVHLDSARRVRQFSTAVETNTELTEETNAEMNGGIYLIRHREVLRGLSELRTGSQLSWERECIPHIIDSGARVFGFHSKASFIDIGTPSDYLAATEMLAIGAPA